MRSEPITEREMQDQIAELLYEMTEVDSVRSFEDAGVLTQNHGLVVKTSSGQEFQIRIVESTRR